MTFSAGLSITRPFTATRPAAIIVSATRREATPARASRLRDALRRVGSSPSRRSIARPYAARRRLHATRRGRAEKGAMTRFAPHMDAALAEARAAFARAETPVGA